MKGFAELVVGRSRVVLVVIALLTAFFGYHAAQMRLDSSVDALLPENDPEKGYYEEIRKLFGSDEIGVIGLIADDIYTPKALEKLRKITKAVEEIDGVQKAASLINVVDPVADAVEPPLLVPKIPTTPEERDALRRKLADRPIFLKNFVSADGRAAAVNIFFKEMSDDEFLRRGIDDTVEAIVERENEPDLRVYYTGLPHFKVYSTKAMWRDLQRFVPLVLVLIVAVLYLSFGSLRGIFLPTLTVAVSLVWTLGVMVLAGSRLSLASTSLPPLILVIGAAYSLHVVAEYYDLARPGRAPREVVLETLGSVGMPVLVAAISTAIGFLSIAVNSIRGVREMGIYSAVGIIIAFFLSVALVPALLAELGLPRVRGREAEGSSSPRLSAALRRIAAASMRNRGLVLAGGALVTALAIIPIFRIQVDSNFQSFFRESDPIRVATDAINKHLVGSGAFYVVIEGSREGVVKEFDTLRRIRDLQRFIDRVPGVEKTASFVDYVEAFDRGAQQAGERDLVLNAEGELVEPTAPSRSTTFWDNPPQLPAAIQIISSSPKTFSAVVDPHFSRTNILVRTSLSRSSDIRDLTQRIEEYAASHFPPELAVRPTGSLILLTKTTGNLVSGQVWSLALSAGAIFIIMGLMFLSVRVGLIAMIPNIFPIVIFLGLMGATGADLNLATNTIASIALGIAVDDTIHIMTRLSAEVRRSGRQEEALLETISTVGKPALYASLLLFLGFLTLCFSTFVPIREFGFLSAMTMVAAVAGELALTPALLSTIRVITLWDLLTLKLGKDPHRTIGLFNDLWSWQAKLVALMAELRSFRRDETIVRQGEEGDAMFVIVNGRAEVRVNVDGQPRTVRTLGRGDVFGEMGLIRRQERTADVVAVEDVELMALDQRFLQRVRRYPRIAAKIFLNIARIVSDRLQEETRRRVAA